MIADWKLIVDAPKQDIIILTDGGYIVTGFWQEGIGWTAGWKNEGMYVRITLVPTHWDFLPLGPAALPAVES